MSLLSISRFALSATILLSASSALAVLIPAERDRQPPTSLTSPPGPATRSPFELSPGLQPSAPDLVPAEVLEKLRASGDSSELRKVGLELKRRLDQNPGDLYLMHALATVMFYEGNPDEARALWKAVSKQEPNLASAELMAAVHGVLLLQSKGDQAEAKKQLTAVEKKYASDPHFQLLRGEQAMRGKNVKAAEVAYRRAYELAPKLYVTNLNLARFLDLVKKDRKSAARFYAESTRLAPKRPEVWKNYAVFLVRQNQPEQALGAFRKLKALDTAAPLPETSMAELSVALARYDEARRWYLAALAQKPSPAEVQAIRVALGDVLLRLKRYEEARREIEAALQVQELPPLVFALATIDEAEGKTQAAEARYRQTLKLTPGNPLATNNLAMLLLKSDREPVEALKLAAEARAAIPNNAIIEGTWGCALVANGRAGEAVTVLEAVVKADPADPWVRYCLSKALIAQKRGSEALPHLKHLLQSDERFPRRDEVNKLISSLR